MRVFRLRLPFAVLSSSALLLAACAAPGQPFGGPQDRITIDSEPQGAHVFASHVELGVTPVTVDVDKAFPRHWTGSTDKDKEGGIFYRRLSTLALRKDGCEPYRTTVDTNDVSHDLKVTLKCDPNYKPTPAAETPAKPQGVTADSESVEGRLLRLENLHKKGVITDQEYQTQRQRVLDEL